MGEKIPLLPSKRVVSALQSIGFEFVSQRGSHRKYRKEGNIVIVPMSDELARGTLRSILAQANITLDEFLKHTK